MIIKCMNCGGALEYDAMSGKMHCPHCESYFDVTPDQQSQNWERTEPENVDTYTNEDMMEVNIYSCSACGAELTINGVESSTFCAYCGQPTIVFNRVGKQKRPKFIIPFAITKRNAEMIIRSQFNTGAYVPDEIKNFSVEKIRGIYVPYYLVDEYYRDRQLIKGEVRSNKNTYTYYYYREAESEFVGVPVDASVTFDNESSQRLEPFDLKGLRLFDEAYLSGYYSDISDEPEENVRALAQHRVGMLVNQKIMDTVQAADLKIIHALPMSEVRRMEYVLLPVWFMVFRYGGKTYTMMVNGQTGKVVGAVPSDKKKVGANIIGLGAVLGVLGAFLVAGLGYLLGGTSEEYLDVLVGGGFLSFAVLAAGIRKKKAYDRSQKLTSSSVIKHYMADRQEG